LCRPTPRPMNKWRLWLLKRFGCQVKGEAFVAGSARVKIPWLLTLEDKSCLGEGAEVYNLGSVTLGKRSVVAQQSYLCAGTHDLSDPVMPLVVGPIEIGADAFIGVRAVILPGIVIEPGSVIGAGAVVTKDMPAWTICAGNPCSALRSRPSEKFKSL